MATPNAAARNATKPLALAVPALLGELDELGAPLLVPLAPLPLAPLLLPPVALEPAGRVVVAREAVANAPTPLRTVLGKTTVAAEEALATNASKVLPLVGGLMAL